MRAARFAAARPPHSGRRSVLALATEEDPESNAVRYPKKEKDHLWLSVSQIGPSPNFPRFREHQ